MHICGDEVMFLSMVYQHIQPAFAYVLSFFK